MIHLALQYPLDSSQSERLLGFCLNSGVDCFAMNFVHGNEDELRCIQAVKDQLMPFRHGTRILERTVWRNEERFTRTECWALNSETIRLIQDACGDSLSNYEMGRFPEDWTFYRKEELLLGLVSHEQYAFLRLPDDKFDEFRRLGIDYTLT